MSDSIRRYQVLFLLFINVVINYMDRTNISIAATSINTQFHLSPVQLGFLFSAFGWTYVACQIPGGLLTDRIAPRILYTFSLLSWSCVTLFQGIAGGFAVLFGLRLATGVLEAPAYPINNRVVTTWFPKNERASAIALYTSGQFIGLALLTPLMAIVQHYVGWRGLFIGTGIIGIAWGLVWYGVYRDPLHPAGQKAAEARPLESEGGLMQFKAVFSRRKLWGIYIGQFAVTSVLWFFLTWFPIYLEKYRGVHFLTSGLLASIPFLAAFIGIILSGYLSDFMVNKKVSADIARKLPVIAGLVLSMSIALASYVHGTEMIILCLAVAFFGNGMASISWVFVSLLSPRHLVGMTGGAFNFIGSLSSIIIPIVIGYLVKGGDFAPALLFISGLALVGICCYLFLVGKIEGYTP